VDNEYYAITSISSDKNVPFYRSEAHLSIRSISIPADLALRAF